MSIKMNDFVKNILQIRFMPAVTFCYHEHALNAGAHLSRRCYATLGATRAEIWLLSTAYCME